MFSDTSSCGCTLPTVGGIGRTLNRRPAPGVVVIVLALVGAFFVSRGCQRSTVRITQDQAVALGQRYIDFKPAGHNVRIVPQGLPPKRYWGVSYWIREKNGKGYARCETVLLDTNTGVLQKGYPKDC